MKFILISVFIFVSIQSIFADLIDNVYLNTSYQIKSIKEDSDPFLKKYFFKENFTEFDKKEIIATLEDVNFFSKKDFYKLLSYAELLHRVEDNKLSFYYRNLCFQKYKNNNNYNLLLYITAYRYNWVELKTKILPQLQQYRLSNNVQSYLFLSDLLVATSRFDHLSSIEKDTIINLAQSLNSTDISLYVFKFFKDVTELRFASLYGNLKMIFDNLTNDFYNLNMLSINVVRFIALFFNIIFIIIGFIILLRRRKLIYHFFIHKLPKNAPLNIHRLFFILITLICYFILGINGLILFYSFIIVAYVSKRERYLLAFGGILFLLNFFMYQAVYFMYVPVTHKSPYYLYYESFKEGYNQIVLDECNDYLKAKKHPFVYAAKAVQNSNKGNYGVALENWNNYLKYFPNSAEAILNVANIYLRLGDQRNAEKKYKEVLSIKDIPEAYYDMAKLYLLNFNVAKYNEYINRATELSPILVQKYIADNNKYVGNKRASKLLDVSLPISEYYDYILKDAYNSKYRISGLAQIFVFIKLLIFIFFIVYVLAVRKKHLRLCKTCGMQVCYDCVQGEGLCPICFNRVENVKSQILVNKIKMDIKYFSNIFNMTLFQVVGFFLPGAYDILHGSFRFINVFKVLIMSLLWTFMLFRIEIMGIYKTTYIVEHSFRVLGMAILIIVYIFNFIKVFRMYVEERNLIIKP